MSLIRLQQQEVLQLETLQQVGLPQQVLMQQEVMSQETPFVPLAHRQIHTRCTIHLLPKIQQLVEELQR